MAITCTDICRLPGLNEIQIRAGLQGARRAVRWPYVADTDILAPWVNGGELVFVTGAHHYRTEGRLLKLVQEADSTGVAGLVILTGSDHIKAIPTSVLELANQCQLPVLELPYSVKLVSVTEIISNAIIHDSQLGQSLRHLFTRLLNGYADAPELIALRASELGLDPDKSYSCLAIRPTPGSMPLTNNKQDPLQAWTRQLSDIEAFITGLLSNRGVEWPVLSRERELITLWPIEAEEAIDEALNLLLYRLEQTFPQVRFCTGVSDPQTGLGTLAQAAQQAQQALQFAIQEGNRNIIFYNQLGVAQLFAAIPQRHLLTEFCREQLGPLCFSCDESSVLLKETLRRYLNYSGNQMQTAESLGIHRNTLRYRLSKIEAIIAHSLHDHFTRLNLQNALLIEQILFQNHSIDPGQMQPRESEIENESD